MKRLFLQKAHKYTDQSIGGWYMSEKLDFHRAFWDGGVSRGVPKNQVPWANTEKDERYVDEQIATGLWTGYGNVFHAPDWWLDMMPRMPLDGELCLCDALGQPLRGVSARQECSTIIKSLSTRNWTNIRLAIFDCPQIETVFADGVIDLPNDHRRLKGCLEWIEARNFHWDYRPRVGSYFESVYKRLNMELPYSVSRPCFVLPQVKLPEWDKIALQVLDSNSLAITKKGGEGLMVRKPTGVYTCARVHYILKVKPTQDMEGTVIGYITGRATDKGSKLRGKMGALVLQLDNGQRLELSGFTDQERVLITCDMSRDQSARLQDAMLWAWDHPETECPDGIFARDFKPGTRITFTYRGLSKDGIPQEARYQRIREDE